MTELDRFMRGVHLPKNFGDGETYARLAYVDESRMSGTDVDIEWDPGVSQLRVTVSQWHGGSRHFEREPSQLTRFDLQTGAIVDPQVDVEEDLANLFCSLSGARLVEQPAL